MDEQGERICFSDDCYLDCGTQNLYYKGEVIRRNVSGIPYEIVYLMSGHPDWVYTRDALLEQCWPKEANTADLGPQTVDAQIKIVRGWHDDVRPTIETVRGKGYKYTGKKRTGNAPSAVEKTEPKPRGKVSVTQGVLLTGAVSQIARGQDSDELLEQVEAKILAEQNPCAELQTLRKTVGQLSKPSALDAVTSRLEMLRDTYNLSDEALLRLEAVILAAQRKLFEQRYYLALDRLAEQRTRQARASMEETIEGIERDIQGVDEDLARVDAELGISTSYKIEFGG